MIWLQLICTEPETWRRTIVKSLSRAGVNVAEPSAERRSSGIVVFDDPAAEVVTSVRELSHGGVNRVLALATTGAALATGFAWQLLQAGASDVFAWDHTDCVPAEIAARLERWEEVDALVASPAVQEHLAGRSSVWISTVRQVAEVAAFSRGSVLLLGESGTGKEVMAGLIHELDRRPDKKELVVLDCTTVVPELSGSEFFGHERGAFTGAVAPRDGAFALADGGTLFLDEVGELPPGLQAQLLRVVQEHTFKRVGGNTWHHTEFRLVCATNRDLSEDVARGHFRRDLYHRIAGHICRLAPLSARPEDVLALVEHFLVESSPDGRAPELDGPVREYLLNREYPGNVRDLQQLVARISERHVGPGPITVGGIPSDELSAADEVGGWQGRWLRPAIQRGLETGATLDDIRRAAVDIAIQLTVDREHGNLQRAARRLGVTDRALQMRRAHKGA
jgi:transcriptional regulator with GAF, ATPase, and Fis domain